MHKRFAVYRSQRAIAPGTNASVSLADDAEAIIRAHRCHAHLLRTILCAIIYTDTFLCGEGLSLDTLEQCGEKGPRAVIDGATD